MLTTRRKLQIARAASWALRTARRAAGRPERVVARRGGIAWELDLAEGIDLAVYLGVYQRVPPRVRDGILRPGMAALDIGANIGAFALPLAAALGPGGAVLAVEATAYAAGKLRRNLDLNPAVADRVLIRQRVLVADEGAAAPDAVYSSWRLDASGDGAPRHPAHGGLAEATTGGRAATLDGLLAEDAEAAAIEPRIGFVKLDVDGHELDVLSGGRGFFSRRRPPILLEVAPYVQDEVPGRLDRLLGELARLGYRLEDAATGRAYPSDAAGLRRVIPDGAGTDVLCRAA